MDKMRLILLLVGLILLVAIYWMGRRDERRAQEKVQGKKLAQPLSSPLTPSHAPPPTEDTVLDENPERAHADYDSFYLGDDDQEVYFRIPVKSSPGVQNSLRAAYSNAPKTAAKVKSDTLLVSADEPPEPIQPLPAGVEPLIINLTVMAPKDMSFDPYFLKQTLDSSGLVHGDMNIYHYYRKPKLEFEVNRGQRLFSVANIVEPGYFDPQDIETYRSPGIAMFLQLPGPIDGVLAFEKMHQMAVMLAKQLSGILCDDRRNKITLQTVTHLKDQISEFNLKLRSKLGRTVH
jgi:cell division protein ZipA